MLSNYLLFEDKQLVSTALGEIVNMGFLSNLGNAKPSKNTIVVESLEDAIKELNSKNNKDARENAWEDMRVKLLKSESKDIWEGNFKRWKRLIERTLFNRQAKNLAKKMNVSKEEFFAQMPFMGIVGELLLTGNRNNDLFFTNQLPIFQNGNLVCGYNGRSGKYPENKYKIF